jgi:DNA-binding NarL/FixJ family response regulator
MALQVYSRLMTRAAASCVLLADRHHRLIEAVRDMLEADFATLFIVAGESSLLEGASRLQPSVVIVDLSIVSARAREVLRDIRECSPHSRTLLLSVHDQASAARFALEAGADGVVLKRALATDLVPAVDAVLAGGRYVSPGFGQIVRCEAGGAGS